MNNFTQDNILPSGRGGTQEKSNVFSELKNNGTPLSLKTDLAAVTPSPEKAKLEPSNIEINQIKNGPQVETQSSKGKKLGVEIDLSNKDAVFK